MDLCAALSFLELTPSPTTTELTFVVNDPATQQVIVDVVDGSVAGAQAPLDVADRAFGAWSARAPRGRAEILRAGYELTMKHIDVLTTLSCAENGKSQDDAYAEVGYAADLLRWFSKEAARDLDNYILDPEIFGPIASIVSGQDESRLVGWRNDTELGLAAYVFSGAVCDSSVLFGGMKRSGIRREGAREGLRTFQEPQMFSVGLESLGAPGESTAGQRRAGF